MNRESVNSSNLSSVGYDNQSQTLEIEFQNGSVYQYFDIPEGVYQEFLTSGSLGSYLASHIKGNYRFSRV